MGISCNLHAFAFSPQSVRAMDDIHAERHCLKIFIKIAISGVHTIRMIRRWNRIQSDSWMHSAATAFPRNATRIAISGAHTIPMSRR